MLKGITISTMLALLVLAVVVALPAFRILGQEPATVDGRLSYDQARIDGFGSRLERLEQFMIRSEGRQSQMEANLGNLKEELDSIKNWVFSLLSATLAIVVKQVYDVVVDKRSNKIIVDAQTNRVR